MMPALLVIGVGRRRLIPIPLPVILVWPLVFLAFAAVRLTRLALAVLGRTPGGIAAADTGLRAFFELSGLRIDIEPGDGGRFRIQFI